MDVGSSRSAANVVGLVQGALKTLVIDLAVLLEGHSIVRASLAMPLALYCMIHRPLARYPGHRTGRAPGGPLHRARFPCYAPCTVLYDSQTPGAWRVTLVIDLAALLEGHSTVRAPPFPAPCVVHRPLAVLLENHSTVRASLAVPRAPCGCQTPRCMTP